MASRARKARQKWLNSLNEIRELKPSIVILGHSKVGVPLDASSAMNFTENYLLAFEEELKKPKIRLLSGYDLGFYRVVFDARATNSSNLESKSFRAGDSFDFL